MGYRVDGRPVPGQPPCVEPITYTRVLSACWRGDLPAEQLSPVDRETLIYDLWFAGWTDVEIATHTSLTTYTTARIRDRLGLAPRPARKESYARGA
ncbi:hypothetical protein F9C11_20365 [Amycolatopsis sp. VS8301801F10]|uniref:hypothetical protein n=1 Tax=unclassified Amycolatopsis TaxID=2618356 RepID=UPI0038FC9C72